MVPRSRIELLHRLIDYGKGLIGLVDLRIELLKALAGLLRTLGQRREPLLILGKRLLEGLAKLVELGGQTGNLLRKLGELLLGLAQALLPGGGIHTQRRQL